MRWQRGAALALAVVGVGVLLLALRSATLPTGALDGPPSDGPLSGPGDWRALLHKMGQEWGGWVKEAPDSPGLARLAKWLGYSRAMVPDGKVSEGNATAQQLTGDSVDSVERWPRVSLSGPVAMPPSFPAAPSLDPGFGPMSDPPWFKPGSKAWLWSGGSEFLLIKESCGALHTVLDGRKGCWGEQRVRKVTTHCAQYGPECSGEKYSNRTGTVDVDIYVADAFAQWGLRPSGAQCNVAWTAEPPSINAAMYERLLHDKSRAAPFNRVLTHSAALLASGGGGKFARFLEPACWVQADPRFVQSTPEAHEFQARYLRDAVSSKDKVVSMIFSEKRAAEGHKRRFKVWEALGAKHGVYGCGRGAGRWVKDKKECLSGFMFTIVIENGKDQGYYFSEKLVDSFMTGTCPIYWGRKGRYVTELFDGQGILFWETLEELEAILESINTPEKARGEFQRRAGAVQCNYLRSMAFTKPVWDRLSEFVAGPNGELNCNLCPSDACVCSGGQGAVATSVQAALGGKSVQANATAPSKLAPAQNRTAKTALTRN